MLLVLATWSPLSFAFEEMENINPFNAASYGVRVYVAGDKYSTEFIIKSMGRWQSFDYKFNQLIIDYEQQFLKNYNVGCYDNKIYTSRLHLPNEIIDRAYFNIQYKSKYGVKTLIIDLKQFLAFVNGHPKDYESFWENGVGTQIENKYLKYYKYNSQKCNF